MRDPSLDSTEPGSQVAVADLQRQGRMIGRPTCSRWHPIEAQWFKVEFFNECLDVRDRIALGNEVIEAFRPLPLTKSLITVFGFF